MESLPGGESLNGHQQSFFRAIIGNPGFVEWAKLVEYVRAYRVSDIVFNKGKILVRVMGQLKLLPEELQVNVSVYEKALVSTLPGERHLSELMGEDGSTDFGAMIHGMRMRGNVYRELEGMNGAFRPILEDVLPPEEIRLDKKIYDILLSSKQGLVLVTGATGSGKSATVAAILETINQTHEYNIITIEDPIEYVFKPQLCRFSQREIGQHASSFDAALRSAVRQNPDIIFVGEVRDYATAKAAIRAAETGHLVFATLHTRRVTSTLNRLINMAPASERDQIKDGVAQNMLMILCQHLLKKKDESGVIPCREIAIRNHAIVNGISSEKMRDLSNVMMSNRPLGMCDWNSALNLLVQDRVISEPEAARYRDRESEL